MPQLVVKLKDREIQRVSINNPQTRIGRDPTSDVVIDNMGVSRHHAVLEFDGENFRVRDEGSANGIFVNGQPSNRAVLKNGDAIQLGKFSVIFSRGGGTPVEKLARTALLPGAASPASPALVQDPHMTTALSTEAIERLINAGPLGQPARAPAPSTQAALSAVPAPPARSINSPAPRRADSHGVLAFGGTLFNGSSQRIQEQANALRNLTIVLAVAVVGLVGLTVALLTIG